MDTRELAGTLLSLAAFAQRTGDQALMEKTSQALLSAITEMPDIGDADALPELVMMLEKSVSAWRPKPHGPYTPS